MKMNEVRVSHQEKQLLMKKFFQVNIRILENVYPHCEQPFPILEEFSDKIRSINKYAFGHRNEMCKCL